MSSSGPTKTLKSTRKKRAIKNVQTASLFIVKNKVITLFTIV